MNAKDFLKQIKKLDKLIENKMIEVQQWKEIAQNTTASNPSADRVQSSSNPHRISDAIDRYIDLEKEINRYVDELVDTKKAVISVIEQLEALEYDILHKMYVQNFTLYDVADKYDRSYSWATTIHGHALKNVQKILDSGQQII